MHTAYRAVIAVDWSGDAHLARSRIYLAEADETGRLVRLEAGRTRPELIEHLLTTSASVIGLDFGFSFPHAFLNQLDVRSAPDLWRLATRQGETWIQACDPPFWGRPGKPRPTAYEAYRRTERAVPRTAGIAPKSMFQLGGGGAVGTGSLRGMSLLLALHEHNSRIWPFTDHGARSVVEIYPRLLTGPVRKSDPSAREHLLQTRYPDLQPAFLTAATASEDAFDAAVSALVMIEHIDELTSLPIEPDPRLRMEGRIWHPAWRDDPP